MKQTRKPAGFSDSSRITVTHDDSGFPFSKGILSQSLLATAMDSNEAFEVARAIEHELLDGRRRTIDRSELRALACRVLERRSGADIAARYLLWRRYQEPDRPVILLLGGTSGVGKSALAVEVARRLGVGRVLSTDSIRQIMRIMTSQQLVPALYGSSYDAWKLLPREGGRVPSVIEGFRAQASAVGVGVRASLDRTVSESANLVIDGVSIVPGSIDLAPYEGVAHVVVLLLATLDEDALRKRFQARAGGQKHRLAHRYLENFEAILTIQRHLLERAERHGVPVIDNLSFDASVRAVIEAAMDELAAQEERARAEEPPALF
jgi:2-phosphoglycerate kinase